MSKVFISNFPFRIEVSFPFDGDFQKTIVYRFEKLSHLVSFVFENLRLLELHPYVVFFKDVVLESFIPSSFVDNLDTNV